MAGSATQGNLSMSAEKDLNKVMEAKKTAGPREDFRQTLYNFRGSYIGMLKKDVYPFLDKIVKEDHEGHDICAIKEFVEITDEKAEDISEEDGKERKNSYEIKKAVKIINDVLDVEPKKAWDENKRIVLTQIQKLKQIDEEFEKYGPSGIFGSDSRHWKNVKKECEDELKKYLDVSRVPMVEILGIVPDLSEFNGIVVGKSDPGHMHG